MTSLTTVVPSIFPDTIFLTAGPLLIDVSKTVDPLARVIVVGIAG